MNKTGVIGIIMTIFAIFFLTGCDVYQDLYGEGELTPLENIGDEVDQTLDEILPQDSEETAQEPLTDDVILEEPEVVEEEAQLEEEPLQEEVPAEELEPIAVEEPELFEETPLEEEVVAEEQTSTQPDPDAVVITVKETELISLVTEAEDPDQDKLFFTFTNPLDENGKWQTTYGDNGQYTVTITASDGELTTSQEVLIIVNKKEEEPRIDSFAPSEEKVSIREAENVEFSILASDLNDDELTYSWKVNGEEVSTDEQFYFETNYEDAGSHTVKVDVSDGNTEISKSWFLDVDNVNRKPVLEALETITVKETETVTIMGSATDPDEDELTFEISEPVGNDGIWETGYTDAGEYTVTVLVSDGTDSVSQDVQIIVEDVNRPPVITGIIQKS